MNGKEIPDRYQYTYRVFERSTTGCISSICKRHYFRNFIISIINRIEVLGFPSSDKQVDAFLDLAHQYELTKDVALKTIELRKVHKIKLPDAIVAATALVYDLGIITRNVKDFENIKGINVVNPHSLSK